MDDHVPYLTPDGQRRINHIIRKKNSEYNTAVERITKVRSENEKFRRANDKVRATLSAQVSEYRCLRGALDRLRDTQKWALRGNILLHKAQRDVDAAAHMTGYAEGRRVFFRDRMDTVDKSHKVTHSLARFSPTFNQSRTYGAKSLSRPHSALESVQDLACSVQVLHENIIRSPTRRDARERRTVARLNELLEDTHQAPPKAKPRAEIERLCERLYREDTTRRQGERERLDQHYYPVEETDPNKTATEDTIAEFVERCVTGHLERQSERIAKAESEMYPEGGEEDVGDEDEDGVGGPLTPERERALAQRMCNESVERKAHKHRLIEQEVARKWQRDQDEIVARLRRSRGKGWSPKTKITPDELNVSVVRLSQKTNPV